MISSLTLKWVARADYNCFQIFLKSVETLHLPVENIVIEACCSKAHEGVRFYHNIVVHVTNYFRCIQCSLHLSVITVPAIRIYTYYRICQSVWSFFYHFTYNDVRDRQNNKWTQSYTFNISAQFCRCSYCMIDNN